MKVSSIKQPLDPAQDGQSKMKKITSIRSQVKRQGRYSIFVDGKFAFGLSEDGLLASGLTVGQDIEPAELKKLKENAANDKLWNRVLALLARRARSEWEIREYLLRKKVPEADISEVVERLRIKNFVNDEQFARMWVENRRLLKAVSKRRLQAELRAKRIDTSIIKTVLDSDETDEKDILRNLIERKRGQTRYRDDQKLMGFLIRQGFNYSDVKDILNSEN